MPCCCPCPDSCPSLCVSSRLVSTASSLTQLPTATSLMVWEGAGGSRVLPLGGLGSSWNFLKPLATRAGLAVVLLYEEQIWLLPQRPA